MTDAYDILDTPIGPLLVVTNGVALTRIAFPRDGRAAAAPLDIARGGPVIDRAATQLDEYFAGARHAFELPLAPRGTAFQRAVWDQLVRIPYALTVSYGDLAQRIGNRNASRAVGAANGANPLPIIVPCHRVIGSQGDLTGFGGGLPLKRWLLAHERRHAPATALVLT